MTTTFGINGLVESFNPPSRNDGISAVILKDRTHPLTHIKPIAHITTHGDVFCVNCKTPERYDDGHLWAPIFETGKRQDTCDECQRTIGEKQ